MPPNPKADDGSLEHKDRLESVLTKSFLNLEKIDPNLYRSTFLYHPTGARSVFGGLVIGQALVAASKTVPPDQHAHSLHCYFLRGGNVKNQILYHVDQTREGKTYCSRSIKATQDGLAIFTMQASFKKMEKDPYHHQYTMPKVPGPEGLANKEELLWDKLGMPDTPKSRKYYIRKKLTEEITMEVRPVVKEQYYSEKPFEPKRHMWVRAIGKIGDDMNMHKCVAAYMSDSELINVSLLPAAPNNPDNFQKFFVTSLDHTMWFHNPVRADEWMLYEMESPQCGDGKALLLGRLWRPDGVLAISVAQECVLRTWTAKL